EITKTASTGNFVLGNTITYSFKVVNTGDVVLNNVFVNDPLQGLSAITPSSVSSLAIGAETTFTATYIVTQADVDNGKIDNTATATGTPPIGNDVSDSDD